MKMKVAALTGALFLVASGVQAQTPAVTPAQVPLVAGASDSAMLRTGTKVPLKTSEELTTKGKKLKVGQRINLEVAEAVLVNGQVVIPLGAPAVGEITEVRNKGMWGKSGKFVGQVQYVTVAGRQVKLTGSFDDKGHAGGGAAVATSAIVFLPAGFFMTGTSAKLAMGSPVVGFIGEDIPVSLAAAPVTPLQALPAAVVAPAAASPQPTMINAVATKPAK